jgi:hypothetical protein
MNEYNVIWRSEGKWGGLWKYEKRRIVSGRNK